MALWTLIRDVPTTDDCITWTHAICSGSGYGHVQYNHRRWRVHRLSFLLHRGIIPDGIQVCHSCDNPPCFNPQHLFLGTQKENIQDAINKGRLYTPRGELHGRSLLTATDVLNIRSAYRPYVRGFGYRKLAEKYGVSDDAIRCIIKRISWRHV